MVYVGGDIDYMDYCHPEFMSLCELDKIMGKIGLVELFWYYFVKRGCDFNSGLWYLLNDQDAMDMVEMGAKKRKIDLYVVQLSFTGLLKGREGGDVDIGTESSGGGESSKPEDIDTDFGTKYMDGIDVTESGRVKMMIPVMEIFFYDTDCDLSDDDNILYEKYVDGDVEFTAGKEKLKEVGSDGEGVTENIRFNPKTNNHDPKFRNGTVFKDTAEFKDVVRAHAVLWQRNINFFKNDFQKVRAKCKGNNCTWVVLASRMMHSETFQIRTLNAKHKCGRTLNKNKFVTSRLLSNKYKTDWRLSNGFDLEISKKRQGFLQGYKTLIGVDGCHLMGSHKGILLIVVGIDPNNYIFPICYCVIEDEDFNTWKWFLELFIGDLGIYDQQKWTFVSGMQKGLLPTLHWSRAHFRTSPKCDILLNNMCESFNSAILEARSKPLLAMVERLSTYLMKRMQSKRNAMSRWNVQICPKILAKMDKLKDNT
ncbi:hypothetical protein BUALT_Bualt06G0094600 [Buddleja alternifolia]|uniref:Transposase n=1 Tax=Buddleja alternifolia TaxID=168488 RepID=A0AAV6XE35_9LAMI|nr:hypothetical protein BUALT_Bualt06G0094600 [Buddleja alternifolia]